MWALWQGTVDPPLMPAARRIMVASISTHLHMHLVRQTVILPYQRVPHLYVTITDKALTVWHETGE